MPRRRQKYKTWGAVFKKKAEILNPNKMPLQRGKDHGSEVSREVIEEGITRKIIIHYTYGDDEIIEYCGKIRIR